MAVCFIKKENLLKGRKILKHCTKDWRNNDNSSSLKFRLEVWYEIRKAAILLKSDLRNITMP